MTRVQFRARRPVALLAAAVAAATLVAGPGPTAGAVPARPRIVLDVPAAPGQVWAGCCATPGEVLLRWAPPDDSGVPPVLGYVITPSLRGAALAPFTVDVGPSPAATVRMAASFPDGYTFAVRAFNEVGVGAAAVSNPVVVPVPPAAPPGIGVEAGLGSVRVWWARPGSDGGSPITGYLVEVTAGGAPVRSAPAGATATSQVIDGLEPAIPYSFRVRAVNGAGPGAPSDARTATPQSVPLRPLSVRALPGAGRVYVSWTPPAGDGGTDITEYRVTAFLGGNVTAPGAAVRSVRVAPATTSVEVGGLDDWKAYTFTVQAVNRWGAGAESEATWPVVPRPSAPFPTFSETIQQTWLDMIGRLPTATERAGWERVLYPGTRTPADLVVRLRGSNDHAAHVDPVLRLFLASFGRVPSAIEADVLVAQMRIGTRLRTLADFLAGTSEFARRYGSLSNRQFVEQLYLDVLHRPGSSTWVGNWTAALEAGRLSRGAVVAEFAATTEYRAIVANELLVVVLYVQLLDRAPTELEVVGATNQLARGYRTPLSLADEIVHSRGYVERFS